MKSHKCIKCGIEKLRRRSTQRYASGAYAYFDENNKRWNSYVCYDCNLSKVKECHQRKRSHLASAEEL